MMTRKKKTSKEQCPIDADLLIKALGGKDNITALEASPSKLKATGKRKSMCVTSSRRTTPRMTATSLSLAGPTEATDKLWGSSQELQKEERAKGGVLDMETEVVSGLTAYGPGYIDEAEGS